MAETKSEPRSGDVEHQGLDRIYLEPLPVADEAEGRCWCEDDVWPTDAADDRGRGVEYVRADILAEREAEIERLRALLRESWEHHDYCGFGDSWERKCAKDSGLIAKLEAEFDKEGNR